MSFKPPPLRPIYICPSCLRQSVRPRRRISNYTKATKPTLPLSRLNSYKATTPPTNAQLKYSSAYFTSTEPSFLFSAAHFRDFPAESTAPEVAFLGRSNVGKSSLLNALFGYNGEEKGKERLAFVSKKPGRTRCMNVFGIGAATMGAGRKVDIRAGLSKELLGKDGSRKGGDGNARVRNVIGRGGLCVVDMPGYGFASRDEWGREIVKYLQGRRQLRRAFVLIDAKVGVTALDEQILEVLRKSGTSFQVVVSKVDKVGKVLGEKVLGEEKLERCYRELERVYERVREKVMPEGMRVGYALDDILATSSAKRLAKGEFVGIDGLRWAILQATGLQCDENGRRRSINVEVREDSGERDIERWSPQEPMDGPGGFERLMGSGQNSPRLRMASKQ